MHTKCKLSHYFCFQENVVGREQPIYSPTIQEKFVEIQLLISAVLEIYEADPSSDQAGDEIKENIAKLELLVGKLEQNIPDAHNQLFHYLQVVQCLMLLVTELKQNFLGLIKSTPGNSHVQLKIADHLFSGFYFDPYNIRYSFAAAIAVLTVPFVWLYLDLPGYSQIVISIIACVTLTNVATRFKGYLRLLGCLVGAVVAFLMLGVGIENIFVMLGALFLTTFLCGLVTFGEDRISYFGVQAFLVIIVALVGDVSPALSLGPPMERLIGVVLGVLCVVFFQTLISPDDSQENLKHMVRQTDNAFEELCKWIFEDHEAELVRVDHWQHKRLFANCVIAVRNFETLDLEAGSKISNHEEKIVENYRGLLHSLYVYISALSDFPHHFSDTNGGNKFSPIIDQIHLLTGKEEGKRQTLTEAYLLELLQNIEHQMEDLKQTLDIVELPEQELIFNVSLLRIVEHILTARQLAFSFPVAVSREG